MVKTDPISRKKCHKDPTIHPSQNCCVDNHLISKLSDRNPYRPPPYIYYKRLTRTSGNCKIVTYTLPDI